MSIPTIAILPYRKVSRRALSLEYRVRPLEMPQRRFRNRYVMVPDIDLSSYRFQAVFDWIEFEVHFAQRTQAQHVQKVLRRFHERDSWIVPKDTGAGATFSSCTIKVQAPKSRATITAMHAALIDAYGEAARSRVTGIEVSVDIYPRKPSELARAKMLGVLQRSIWTDRDILAQANSYPRFVWGRGRKSQQKMLPVLRGLDAGNGAAKTSGDHYSPWEQHELHHTPGLDTTMYLGAKTDDVMIRIMDKVVDEQRPDQTKRDLDEKEKRVRIEVTLQGKALEEFGLSDVPTLDGFKVTTLQGDFFTFRLPTVVGPVQGQSDALHAVRVWLDRHRIEGYLKTGMVGLSAMDHGRDKRLKPVRRKVREQLKKAGKPVLSSLDERVAQSYCAYQDLNQRVAAAMRDLIKREERVNAKRHAL